MGLIPGIVSTGKASGLPIETETGTISLIHFDGNVLAAVGPDIVGVETPSYRANSDPLFGQEASMDGMPSNSMTINRPLYLSNPANQYTIEWFWNATSITQAAYPVGQDIDSDYVFLTQFSSWFHRIILKRKDNTLNSITCPSPNTGPHHFAIVYRDDNTVKVFKDGALAASVVRGELNDVLLIGMSQTAIGNGFIDEFKITGSDMSNGGLTFTVPTAPYGSSLGPELLTDPEFDSPGAWTISGDVVVSGGVCTWGPSAANGSYAREGGLLTSGIEYEFTFTIDSISAGEIRALANGVAGTSFSTPGEHTDRITSNGALAQIACVGNTTAVVSKFSVKEVL